jgi:hypothetical protein
VPDFKPSKPLAGNGASAPGANVPSQTHPPHLRELLQLFSFPANPTAFKSTDGGCSETILPDESVQRVREYFSRQSPFKN